MRASITAVPWISSPWLELVATNVPVSVSACTRDVRAHEPHEPGVDECEQLAQAFRRRTTCVVHEEAQPPRADPLEGAIVG